MRPLHEHAQELFLGSISSRSLGECNFHVNDMPTLRVTCILADDDRHSLKVFLILDSSSQ